MALAKYKRTKSGSSFVSQTSGSDIPSVQRGQGSRQIRQLQTIATQKANKDEQSFLQGTRLGLNQGKVSEVGYYNTLAEYYNNKLATTNDPLEQVKLQNKIYTYMDAAKNAAESSAGKASSAASKAANADYIQFKNDLKDAKADIFHKLANGGYQTSGAFLDDLQKIYESERSGLEQVVNSDVFSDSSRVSAQQRSEDMQRQYETPDGTGDYAGLKYRLENKDRFKIVQSQSGKFPGGIDLVPDTQIKEGNEVGQYVFGKDGIYRQVKEYQEKLNFNGDRVIVDASNGQQVSVADMGKYADLLGKKFVEYSDPNDPFNFQGKKHIETFNENSGRFERDSGLQLEDGSNFPYDASRNIFKPVDVPRTNINTGNQPGLSFGDGSTDLLNVEFKQPKFERKKNEVGRYDFSKDGQSISVDDYTKGTGMSREDALRGEEDIRKNPVSVLQSAGKSASHGYNKFKSFFKGLYG